MTIVQLGDIAAINPSAPRTLRSRKDLPVSFVEMANVSEQGEIVGYRPERLANVHGKYRYFERGDVLLAKITPCMENGKAALVDGLPTHVGFGSTEFHVIRPGARAHGRYLFYLVWNRRFRETAEQFMTGTAGQKRVSSTYLHELVVPLPPLDEQRRIAAILDKADGIRRKRQEALTLTERLLRSTFVEMFGDPVMNPRAWPTCRLDALADIGTGVMKGRDHHGAATVDVPYMRVANVQDGYLRLDEIKSIAVLEPDVAKYGLREGDVLLTEGGDPDKLGRGAIWTAPFSPCIHQNHIFRVRVDRSRSSPEYLVALLASPHGKRYFSRQAKQTTGIATINKSQLAEFPVSCPPLALQHRYAEFVAAHAALQARAVAGLSTTNALFESLTHSAFT